MGSGRGCAVDMPGRVSVMRASSRDALHGVTLSLCASHPLWSGTVTCAELGESSVQVCDHLAVANVARKSLIGSVQAFDSSLEGLFVCLWSFGWAGCFLRILLVVSEGLNHESVHCRLCQRLDLDVQH